MPGYYDEITGEYIDTGDDSYGYNQLDNSSGTGTVGDYDDSWFWDSIGIDPSTTSDFSGSPSNDQIWNQIQGGGSWLANLGKDALNALKGAYTKKVNGKDVTDWRAIAATAGGLYGLYQSNQSQPKTGYQGSIPKYEAVREATPGTFDPDRRPGSGGQRYFSQMKYAAPGEAAETARTAAREEAAGLEALNRANPAQQRRNPTTDAAAKGEQSANVREGRPASEVIQDKPVPQYATGGITALAKGRYLGGATDGMADKIPARIDGKQEARLSHGEFVVSADVVSALGGGNSDAGAKRLYDMMDRIRTAAHGKKQQMRPVDPAKVLPK
jgi:hypothetical protein